MKLIFLELFLDVLTTRSHTSTWQCYCGVNVVSVTICGQYVSLMASSSGGQIGALCAESFCKRILSEANDMCHDVNTLLDTEEINMLVVLRMDREFIQHMRENYPKLSGQNFNISIGDFVRNFYDSRLSKFF